MRAANRTKVFALGTGITVLGVLRTLSKADADVFTLPEVDRFTSRSRWYRAGPRALEGVKPDTLSQFLEGLPSPVVLRPALLRVKRWISSLIKRVSARRSTGSSCRIQRRA